MSHAVRATAVPRVLAALNAWFDGHADHAFSAGVAGRLVYHDAPRGWTMPYAVLDFPILRARDTWTGRVSLVGIQIMVYASTKTVAADLASLAADLFEGVRISGAGLADFQFSRGDDLPPIKTNDATWQAGIQLSGRVQIIP